MFWEESGAEERLPNILGILHCFLHSLAPGGSVEGREGTRIGSGGAKEIGTEREGRTVGLTS